MEPINLIIYFFPSFLCQTHKDFLTWGFKGSRWSSFLSSHSLNLNALEFTLPTSIKKHAYMNCELTTYGLKCQTIKHTSQINQHINCKLTRKSLQCLTVQHTVTGHRQLVGLDLNIPSAVSQLCAYSQLIWVSQDDAEGCQKVWGCSRFGLVFLQEMSIKFIAKTRTRISNAPDWPLYHINLWPSFISNLLLSTRYRCWFSLAPWFCKPVASWMKTQQPLST